MKDIQELPRKKSILVIDDEDLIRSLIKSVLEKYYEIITKNNGHDALVYLSEGNVPDLILLDMEMPEMNGRVFLRRVRYGDAKHNKIPIIFISSESGKTIIASTLKLLVHDYIVKPFSKEDLFAKVQNILPI